MTKVNSIFNGTSHDVNVYSSKDVTYNPETRKYVINSEECLPIKTYPKNIMLNGKFSEICNPSIEIDNGVNIYDKVLESLDALPEGFDFYIVSAVYANAYQTHYSPLEESDNGNKMLGIHNPVINHQGKIIGCLGFIWA
jgi:hypothetical protein